MVHDFRRSFIFYELAFKKNTHQFNGDINKLKKSLKTFEVKNLNDKLLIKKCEEIISIEIEIKQVESNIVDISRIKGIEKKIYHQRHQLLNLNFEDLLNKRLVVNPLIEIYSSDFQWISSVRESEIYRVQDALKQPISENYFILQKSGCFFPRKNNHILEHQISEYIYYLICLANQPVKLKELLETFHLQFDVLTLKGKNQLRKISIDLVRNIIFQTFIILDDLYEPLED